MSDIYKMNKKRRRRSSSNRSRCGRKVANEKRHHCISDSTNEKEIAICIIWMEYSSRHRINAF